MRSEEVRGEDDLSAGDRDRERRDSRCFAAEVAMKLRVSGIGFGGEDETMKSCSLRYLLSWLEQGLGYSDNCNEERLEEKICVFR